MSDWSPAEDAILEDIWASCTSLTLSLHRLPGRTRSMARGRATRLGIAGTANPQKRRKQRASAVDASIRMQLKEGRQRTVLQLVEATGHSKEQVRERLGMGHGPKFHIAGWTRSRNHGEWSPKWASGPGDDAEKPVPKEGRHSSREYRRRQQLKQSNSPFAGLIQQVTA
jgi:hypothetical protein